MMENFEEKAIPYQLRCMNNLNLPIARTIHYGTDTVKFMGQRICAKLPTEITNSASLRVFKKHLESTKRTHFNCRNCKTCIYGLGFLQLACTLPFLVSYIHLCK